MGRARRRNRRGKSNNDNNKNGDASTRRSPRYLDHDDDYPMHGVDSPPFQPKRHAPGNQHGNQRNHKPARGGVHAKKPPHTAPGRQHRQSAASRGQNQNRRNRNRARSVSTDDGDGGAAPVSPLSGLYDGTDNENENDDGDDDDDDNGDGEVTNTHHHHHNHHRHNKSRSTLNTSTNSNSSSTNSRRAAAAAAATALAAATTAARFCTECRDVRRANLRYRDWAEAHLRRGWRRFARWSDEAGVGFGAADEMDWQPEPVIRVLIVGGGGAAYSGCGGGGGGAGGDGGESSGSGAGDEEVGGAGGGAGGTGGTGNGYILFPQQQQQQQQQPVQQCQQERWCADSVGPAATVAREVRASMGGSSLRMPGPGIDSSSSSSMGGTAAGTGGALGASCDISRSTAFPTPWHPAASTWYHDEVGAGIGPATAALAASSGA